MDIVKKLAEEFPSIRADRVQNIVSLIDEGNTIPFIARYRKEMTGSCDDQVLREFDERLQYLRNLEKRKEEVAKAITEQGKMTDELQAALTRVQKEERQTPPSQKRSAAPADAGATTAPTTVGAVVPQAASQQDRPKKPVVPFAPWPQVLEALRHVNTALHGALVSTEAFLDGEIVLIDCQDPLFLEMIRSNDYAKKSLHQALQSGAGRDYRIGPFKRERYERKKADDPMEQILASAEKLGVDMSVEN